MKMDCAFDVKVMKSYLAMYNENVRYRTLLDDPRTCPAQVSESVMAPLLAVETSRMYFASSPLV
jgi:hypothetical protein